jgi:hypothetical protein
MIFMYLVNGRVVLGCTRVCRKNYILVASRRQPPRSVSSGVPIKPHMLYVGPLWGSCWEYVGPCWLYAVLSPCWGMLGLFGAYVSHVGSMLGPCWAYVGPFSAQIWQLWGPFKDVEKTQDSRAINGTSPKLKLNSYCAWFGSRIHIKNASAPSARAGLACKTR